MECCFPKHLCLLKAMLKLNKAHFALLKNNSPETEPYTLEALTINLPRSIFHIRWEIRTLHPKSSKYLYPFDIIGHTSVFVFSEMCFCVWPMWCFTVGIIKWKTPSEQFQKNRIVERVKIETLNTNTWPLTILSWDRHFNKEWRGLATFMGPNFDEFR